MSHEISRGYMFLIVILIKAHFHKVCPMLTDCWTNMETQIAAEGLWSRRGQDQWDKIRVKLNIDFCFASTVGLLPFSPGFCKRAIKYHKFHYCFFGNLIDKGMSAGNEHTWVRHSRLFSEGSGLHFTLTVTERNLFLMWPRQNIDEQWLYLDTIKH